MARSINTIQNAIIASLVSAAAAAGETITPSEWSAYDYRQLITYATAVVMSTLEQLWDAFTTLIEGKISAASPQTGAWFQAQMLKFQYDATTPQIIQLDETNGTFAPYYPTVNSAFQIIKYCSVVNGAFGSTSIKVAAQSSGLPVALSSPQLDAAQQYATELSVPGILLTVSSGNSDKIYIAATIYYNGLYASVIEANTISAIKAYLQTKSADNPNGIPFNGLFTLSDLEVAIKSVAGVKDLVFSNVRGRADGTVYPAGTSLVSSNTVIARQYSLASGYCETETTSGATINDSLTFIAS